jgi:imidazolonepropionase-like amidohydrolase
MKKMRFTTLACALALAAAVAWTSRSRAAEGDAYAIRGGTIVTVTGATIAKGTVIIRNGLIAEVGADITVPADARVIDATGMMVYPGLIDAYTNYGLPAPTPGVPTGRGGAPSPPVPVAVATTLASTPPTPVGMSPELQAADQLKIAADTFDGPRSAGITTALVAPREGIFQGQSALINLGADDGEKLILKSPVALNIAFAATRGGGFPTSLMGVFAYLRQSFLDAQQYRAAWDLYEKEKRGLARPPVDKSLAALQPVINGQLPVILQAGTAREIRRAIGLAEEFKLTYLIAGGTQSYEIADYLKSKNATVLLSLNYPQRPTNIEDPESESLRALKERADAPGAAAALHKAGVRFAFQSGYLARPGDFIANAAKAIEAGLPKDVALKALTIYPAQIFGVSEQLGSLEKGKIANLIVTSGDLFERRSQVKHIFIDGKPYEVKTPPPTMAGAGRGPGGRPGGMTMAVGGVWTLSVQSPQGQIAMTLNLQQEGAGFKGDATSQFGTSSITDGQVSGNEIAFSFTSNIQGQQVPITARGTIEGNSIRGTMTVFGQQVEFTGSRAPRQGEDR